MPGEDSGRRSPTRTLGGFHEHCAGSVPESLEIAHPGAENSASSNLDGVCKPGDCVLALFEGPEASLKRGPSTELMH